MDTTFACQLIQDNHVASVSSSFPRLLRNLRALYVYLSSIHIPPFLKKPVVNRLVVTPRPWEALKTSLLNPDASGDVQSLCAICHLSLNMAAEIDHFSMPESFSPETFEKTAT